MRSQEKKQTPNHCTNRSTLKRNIDTRHWLGVNIPDLDVAYVRFRPHILGDCAFSLTMNVKKTICKAEKTANPLMRVWDDHAASTREPLECSFGMLKNRFMVRKVGYKLQHED